MKKFCSGIVLLLLMSCSLMSSAETLREVLMRNGIDAEGCQSANLDKSITSGEEYQDADIFVTAYYLDSGTNELRGPLYVEAFENEQGRWKHAEIDMDSLECPGGSITRIDRTRNGVYLYAHMNPSLGALIALSADLEVRGSVYGSFLADFSDGTVLYTVATVHFASAHPGCVAIWDAKSGERRRIYPLQPYQSIRRQHIAHVQQIYDKHREDLMKWASFLDKPELFSNFVHNAVTNEDTDALAFTATFDDMTPPPEQGQSVDVVYIYRNIRDAETMDYREMLLADVKKKFGDLPLAHLLTKDKLGKIFEGEETPKPLYFPVELDTFGLWLGFD
jgi:hypothetical protein